MDDRFDIEGGTFIVNTLMVVLGEGLNRSQGICERVNVRLMIHYLDEKVLGKALNEMWVL
jgi:hypothetical protein